MLRRRVFKKFVPSQVNDSNTLILLHFDSSLINSGLWGANIGNPVRSSSSWYDTNNFKFGNASLNTTGAVVYFTELIQKDKLGWLYSLILL